MAGSSNKYGYLNRFSVEELENLLQLAVNPQGDDDDSEYVDAILEVIMEKEQEQPTGRLSDVDRAWEEFQTHYNTEEGREYIKAQSIAPVQPVRPKKTRRLLIAAALAALLAAMMTIPVYGYSSTFQLIAHWTAEQFSFLPAAQDNTTAGTINTKPVPEEFQELQTALIDNGISAPCIPTYIPDGFQVVDIDFKNDGGKINFSVGFMKEKDDLSFSADYLRNDLITIYEKDDESVEEYIQGGVAHYIMSNLNHYTVAWCADGIEYSIGTSLPIYEVKNIIDSIYEE